MDKLPDCSVIVLSFNTKDITDQCLVCLKQAAGYSRKYHGSQTEVIVIDNASTDGSVQMIKKKHPWVRLYTSPTNTGFSGGNNIGMAHAAKPYILLLNSDAFVKQDTLTCALQFFQDNPAVDGLGCKLAFADGRLQQSAGFLPNPLNTIFWISGLGLLPIIKNYKQIHPKERHFFAHTRQVEWLMGAFFFIKKEVFIKTGGFDETIFMYGEEVEWCKRIKSAGFTLFYNPNFSVTHLDKASSQFMLEKPLRQEILGIVYYFHKHYPACYPLIKTIIFFSLLLRITIFTLLFNKARQKAYIQSLTVL